MSEEMKSPKRKWIIRPDSTGRWFVPAGPAAEIPRCSNLGAVSSAKDLPLWLLLGDRKDDSFQTTPNGFTIVYATRDTRLEFARKGNVVTFKCQWLAVSPITIAASSLDLVAAVECFPFPLSWQRELSASAETVGARYIGIDDVRAAAFYPIGHMVLVVMPSCALKDDALLSVYNGLSSDALRVATGISTLLASGASESHIAALPFWLLREFLESLLASKVDCRDVLIVPAAITMGEICDALPEPVKEMTRLPWLRRVVVGGWGVEQLSEGVPGLSEWFPWEFEGSGWHIPETP
jgi:hypothetical protein